MKRLTVKELKVKAKEMGLRNYSSLRKSELVEIIEREEKRIAESKIEPAIKSRTTTVDILREAIDKESNGDFSLQEFDDDKGCGYILFGNKTSILFDMDDNFEITITGGDRIAYGDWYDLELDDEYLVECGKKLQEVLYRVKSKKLKLKYDDVYRIYPYESDMIIEERKINGKFYLRDAKCWVGIDNETGDAWTEDFETLEKCIAWLNGEDDGDYECHKCGTIDSPTVSITIEFKDGETYNNLIGECENEEEIITYIEELIEEKNWKDEVKEYSYGYFCPYCLESLE